MMQAILGNAAHPEYGVATIPFPIPRAEYANCVVYDNGARLEPVYDGQHLPCFTYAPAVMMVALSSRLEPDNMSQITWLYLPADEEQLLRSLLCSGIADPADYCFRLEDSVFPAAVEDEPERSNSAF